jgi:ribonuclease III
MRFGIVKSTTDGGEAAEKKKQKQAEAEIEPLGRESYSDIEQALGYKFQSLDALERAFTHRSLAADGAKSDYERLEFVGDAVLDLAVAHLLLDQYPEAKEGDLSKMRAALVNTVSLAQISRDTNLGRFIKLSRGELSSGGADRPSILADVLEAVVGAIYWEAGYTAAFSTVSKLFGESVATVTPTDPKTELQEALHAAGCEAPTYLLECVEGPEHAPTFISVVQVDGQVVGRGRGNTKKASQQNAASEALLLLQKKDAVDEVFSTGKTAQAEPSDEQDE